MMRCLVLAKISSSTGAMSRSEVTTPGTSALVESAISRSTPSVPSRAKPARSVSLPSSGSWSILKSPVCSTTPAGVRMATASASGIEWLTAKNSQSNGPNELRLALHHLDRDRVEAVLGQLALHQGQGQPGADQRDVLALPEQVRDRADVVLVRVREDDRLDLVEPALQVAEVGQDQVHAGLVRIGEQHAAVHDEQAAAVLEDRHVPADLAEPAERDDAQAVAGEGGGRGEVGVRVAHAPPRRPRQLHAARGEVERQLMSFRLGGGEQRGAHRAAGQAEQVERGLGHHRALVAEQPVVHRDELVVELPGAGARRRRRTRRSSRAAGRPPRGRPR